MSNETPLPSPDTALEAPADVVHPRRIRSFVRRTGRVSGAQQKALDTLSEHFIVPYNEAALDYAQLFGNDHPVIFEIGFGMGETTAHIATHLPERNFIGVEVHVPGVGALLKRIEEQQISNLRIVHHDAVEVLQHMIAPNSLAGVHIFFPDPWHKKKHNKRRLIQNPFIQFLVSRIAPGGYLHCATDWQEYAEQMLEVLTAEPALQNTAAGFAPRPDYRPVTKFEARGLRLGHGVWDVVFTKKA